MTVSEERSSVCTKVSTTLMLINFNFKMLKLWTRYRFLFIIGLKMSDYYLPMFTSAIKEYMCNTKKSINLWILKIFLTLNKPLRSSCIRQLHVFSVTASVWVSHTDRKTSLQRQKEFKKNKLPSSGCTWPEQLLSIRQPLSADYTLAPPKWAWTQYRQSAAQAARRAGCRPGGGGGSSRCPVLPPRILMVQDKCFSCGLKPQRKWVNLEYM